MKDLYFDENMQKALLSGTDVNQVKLVETQLNGVAQMHPSIL